MAVRKKAKRPARKAHKARAPRKGRKAAKRAARSTTTRRRALAKPAAPSAPASRRTDSTAAPRCRSRIPVQIDVGGQQARGAIADMSASGARIVGVKLDVPPGTPLQIRYGSETAPMLLSAEMVRATPDGFAVKILPR